MTVRPILFSGPMVNALLDGRKTQTRRVLKAVPAMPVADCHPNNEAKHDAPYLDAYCGERPSPNNPRGMSDQWCWWQVDDRQCPGIFKVGYAPGDLLWVRETWAHYHTINHVRRPHGGAFDEASDGLAAYRADGFDGIEEFRRHVRLTSGADLEDVVINGDRWRPSIHMPRWASRLTLRVADVRVQQLSEINETDAMAEGGQSFAYESALGEGYGHQHAFHHGQDLSHRQDDAAFSTPVESFRDLWDGLNAKRGFGWDANPWVVAVSFEVIRENVDAVLARDAAA